MAIRTWPAPRKYNAVNSFEATLRQRRPKSFSPYLRRMARASFVQWRGVTADIVDVMAICRAKMAQRQIGIIYCSSTRNDKFYCFYLWV